MPVTYFSSADAGTNKTGYAGIKGATGDLIKILNSTLILDTGFTETGASTFADTSNAWIQMGAGTAMFVANNATTDRAYFGGRQKFSQIIMQFATLGVGGTFTIEYWNGSAWTAFSPTDGTSSLTANGTISWTAASLTGWAQTTVNSVLLYFVRIKWATTYSTNPVLKLGSIYGWGSPFQGTNGATYRSQLTSGVQHSLTVNDNGPGAATGQEARIWAAEANTQYNTAPANDGSNGVTKPFPLLTQGVGGNTGYVVARKSADAGTVRTWRMAMDEKTFYLFILTGDAASQYICTMYFGEFFSVMTGDLYRSCIGGRLVENLATVTGNSGSIYPLCNRSAQNTTPINTASSMYIPRVYLGTGASQLGTIVGGNNLSPTAGSGLGFLPLWNGPDGGISTYPVVIYDVIGTTPHIRGRLRGIWDWGHVTGGVNDQDPFSGTGVMSAKTFVALLNLAFRDSAGGVQNSGVMVVETSNTWETN